MSLNVGYPHLHAPAHALGMDHAWQAVTEYIRRDPQSCDALRQFLTTPVTQDLPVNFIRQMSQNAGESLRKKCVQFSECFQTQTLLKEESFIPDIKKALQSGANKYLMATRYQQARDIKLLALGAEIEALTARKALRPFYRGGFAHFFLSSGVKMVMDRRFGSDILCPRNWTKRVQLKDRVYRVEMDDTPFILKERKTNRHVDTSRTGHVDGLTSEEEFKFAAFFHEHRYRDGDLSITWEKPIGYVEFPDGFQFCLFYCAENMVTDGEEHIPFLQGTIEAHPGQFQDEYRDVVARLTQKRYYSHPAIMKGLDHFYRFKEDKTSPANERLPFTFKDFALTKAHALSEDLRNRYENAIDSLGFINRDQDGYALRTHVIDNRVVFELFGFDFERFEMSPGVIMDAEMVALFRFESLGRLYYRNEDRRHLAAYLLLLEKAGLIQIK